MLLALTVTFTLIDFLHCNNLWLHPISALSLKSPKTQWKHFTCKILCKNVNGETIHLSDYEFIDNVNQTTYYRGAIINSLLIFLT